MSTKDITIEIRQDEANAQVQTEIDWHNNKQKKPYNQEQKMDKQFRVTERTGETALEPSIYYLSEDEVTANYPDHRGDISSLEVGDYFKFFISTDTGYEYKVERLL